MSFSCVPLTPIAGPLLSLNRKYPHRYKEGGYEVNQSGFSPDAADILVKPAVEMLSDLRKE
jgi:hypothetical protein